MIIWENILQPLSAALPYDSSLIDAIIHMKSHQLTLSIVTQGDLIVGYIELPFLLEQFTTANTSKQSICYKKDMLRVPATHPVEFFHNISLYLGINDTGKIIGYCKAQEAQDQMNRLHLQHMNHILDSAAVGIITTNMDFEITFANGSAESIIGLSSNILLNRNYKHLIHCGRDIEEVLKGKSFVSVESTINFKKMSGNFSPLYYEDKIYGIIHVFFLKEKFEEAIQELEFVRNLLEDFQAVHALSNEQITVVNPLGEIIRVAGTFLQNFWSLKDEQELIGMNLFDMEKEGILTPNIFLNCMQSMTRVSIIQEHRHGRKIWSLATPIFHEKKLEKVIIVSREITDIERFQDPLANSQIEKKNADQTGDFEKESLDLNIVYRSTIIEDLVEEIKLIAEVDSTVILRGESGVGKEVFAHAIHIHSLRHKAPFIKVNCGALPDNLIESELFGYERGAFTGADQRGKPGLFEMAQNGTIFLDEITELPLHLQVKLLRVLQEKEIMRIGGVKPTKVNFRVIAATNKDLWELVKQNKFREDLYYRIHVIPIEIPPLRERREDIIPLAFHFLHTLNTLYKKEKSLSHEAAQVMESYDWPGNVRELQNIVERLYVTCKHSIITEEQIIRVLYKNTKEKPVSLRVEGIMPLKQAVEEVESQLIQMALKEYRTVTRAAQILGVSKATLSRRINRNFM
ncbi:sigma 54-interacting transcriptional regulator [Aneurinibacillus sp. REN35]|uniref:sigma 54-interacting transcriptional regulator n=1 Tax=Aneurinibacillus sp. REN35 TaxID=3237286 RepID=UPI0035291FDA